MIKLLATSLQWLVLIAVLKMTQIKVNRKDCGKRLHNRSWMWMQLLSLPFAFNHTQLFLEIDLPHHMIFRNLQCRGCTVNFQMQFFVKYPNAATFLTSRSRVLLPNWSHNLFTKILEKRFSMLIADNFSLHLLTLFSLINNEFASFCSWSWVSNPWCVLCNERLKVLYMFEDSVKYNFIKINITVSAHDCCFLCPMMVEIR